MQNAIACQPLANNSQTGLSQQNGSPVETRDFDVLSIGEVDRPERAIAHSPGP
jgi:hypothetical protein